MSVVGYAGIQPTRTHLDGVEDEVRDPQVEVPPLAVYVVGGKVPGQEDKVQVWVLLRDPPEHVAKGPGRHPAAVPAPEAGLLLLRGRLGGGGGVGAALELWAGGAPGAHRVGRVHVDVRELEELGRGGAAGKDCARWFLELISSLIPDAAAAAILNSVSSVVGVDVAAIAAAVSASTFSFSSSCN